MPSSILFSATSISERTWPEFSSSVKSISRPSVAVAVSAGWLSLGPEVSSTSSSREPG